jgi:hypothetical protein
MAVSALHMAFLKPENEAIRSLLQNMRDLLYQRFVRPYNQSENKIATHFTRAVIRLSNMNLRTFQHLKTYSLHLSAARSRISYTCSKGHLPFTTIISHG